MFTCESCKKEFTTLRGLCGHKAFCGKDTERICPICQRKLSCYIYAKHVESHKEDKKCCNCGKTIRSWEKFCSQSCAATYNNKARASKPTPKCVNCGNDIIKKNANKFCCCKCQKDFQHTKFIDNWLSGKEAGGIEQPSNHIRRWLIEKNGNRCMSSDCGWDWTKPCTIELEHKDGNHLNNRPENLMLICPNCHSNTVTYKGKNRGKGRAKRLQRYHDGKTY
jgi:predicted nucleic acid-binding Zn ribbon protein